MKTSQPDETTKPAAELKVESRLTKHADAIYGFRQYANDYRAWPEKEFTIEPNAFFGVVESKAAPSWVSVQDADFLTEQISYVNLVRSGELVRERLQQQLGAVFGYSQSFDEIKGELRTLRQLMEAVSAKVDQFATNLVHAVSITLFSLAPGPFEIACPLSVLIAPDLDGFQASFLDANLHAYGETMEEALSNIKTTIVETHQRLRELPDSQLGQSMLRQKQVLNHHLREAQTG